MEFVILISFMMMAFVAVFTVVQTKTLDMRNEQTQRQIIGLANVIKSEVEMSYTVLDGYQRTFFLQDFVNGEPYDIQLVDNSEIEITYRDKKYYAFLIANISGNFTKGDNVISKVDNRLFLNCENEEFKFVNGYCSDFTDTSSY